MGWAQASSVRFAPARGGAPAHTVHWQVAPGPVGLRPGDSRPARCKAHLVGLVRFIAPKLCPQNEITVSALSLILSRGPGPGLHAAG